MTAFYNECDPYAAQWLENLIAAGHIAPGIVDRRPIQEIEAFELAGFTQCHFFAGIGIWSLALRLAGWSDDRPIWTGSCPCQPFSNAGQRKGTSDERHLWPYWFDLIAQCKPPTVVGEQVASKDGLGWLDIVSADMEGAGYAIGASDLCAAGFGQAHLRQRLYFVAVGQSGFQSGKRDAGGFHGTQEGSTGQGHPDGRHCIGYPDAGEAGGLADDDDEGLEGRPGVSERGNQFSARQGSMDGRLEHPDSASEHGGSSSRQQSLRDERDERDERALIRHPGQTGSLDDADWLLCRNPAGEPSWRAVEPGTFPLAHGVASRMGKLRAFGNALDAETATGFCEVVREICDENGV